MAWLDAASTAKNNQTGQAPNLHLRHLQAPSRTPAPELAIDCETLDLGAPDQPIGPRPSAQPHLRTAAAGLSPAMFRTSLGEQISGGKIIFSCRATHFLKPDTGFFRPLFSRITAPGAQGRSKKW